MQKFSDTITASSSGGLVPLSNATVTVRLAGTTALATLYAANSTSAPLANPLTSTADGRVSFYAADGRYDIVVVKAGYAPITVGDVLLEDPADGVTQVFSGSTITASTINSTPIGATAASTGRFTSVQLASGATGTIALGEMRLNSTENTIDVGMSGGVVGQMFEEQYLTVKNTTGATLTQSRVVTFAGADVDAVPLCGLAIADAAANPLHVIGVLTQDIANGGIGRATTYGKVRTLDTTGSAVGEAWAIGDLLYVHPTVAGALTKVEPTAPNIAVLVGAVLSVNSTTGVILVRSRIPDRTHYGTFTSFVDQTAASINTAYAVTFNTTAVASGVSLSGGNMVVAANAGLYNIQFSAQLTKSSSSAGHVWLWLRVNGSDVANSARKMTVAGSDAEVTMAWNLVASLNAADSFQLMYAFDSTAVSFDAVAATAFCPATPSVILSVTQINQ